MEAAVFSDAKALRKAKKQNTASPTFIIMVYEGNPFKNILLRDMPKGVGLANIPTQTSHETPTKVILKQFPRDITKKQFELRTASF